MRHGQTNENKHKKVQAVPFGYIEMHKVRVSARSLAAIITKGLCLGLLAFSFIPHQVAAAGSPPQFFVASRSLSSHEAVPVTTRTQPAVAPHPKRADFKEEHNTPDARRVADWVVDSADNRGLPFAIVDKVDAKVFVFGADGQIRGAAPCLLGMAKGDDSFPGVGNKKLSEMRFEERTTPAGRFEASIGYNSHGKDILWVSYDLAVSMHRVITSNPKEHRLERLAAPTPLEHRISSGCINVPKKFYEDIVSPTFTGTTGIVYVLPEIRSIPKTFPSYYDVK